MTRFSDKPDSHRMAMRWLVNGTGSEIRSYDGDGFTIAVGKGALGRTEEALNEHGYEMVDLVNFPLGSDNPEPKYKHGSCWLFAKFRESQSPKPYKG